jgi:hypothetical protein
MKPKRVCAGCLAKDTKYASIEIDKAFGIGQLAQEDIEGYPHLFSDKASAFDRFAIFGIKAPKKKANHGPKSILIETLFSIYNAHGSAPFHWEHASHLTQMGFSLRRFLGCINFP